MTKVRRLLSVGVPHEHARQIGRGYPGEFKFGFWTAANIPDGWLPAAGTTIGSAASGASARASQDTWELFNVLWTNGTDANLPVFTSAGAGSTRGASAAADFAADKRILLPNLQGRAVFVQSASGTGSTLGTGFGSLDSTVPAHYHGMGTGADLNITASGDHSHTVPADNGAGSNNAVTWAASKDTSVAHIGTSSDTHTHAAGAFAGRIGLVTGGVDGNAAFGSVNMASFPVYAIIAY